MAIAQNRPVLDIQEQDFTDDSVLPLLNRLFGGRRVINMIVSQKLDFFPQLVRLLPQLRKAQFL